MAGQWENHLPYCLLWRLAPSNYLAHTIAPIENEDFVAPSWSWASRETRVFQRMPRNMEGFHIEPTCRILESHVELASEDLSGRVRSVTLYQDQGRDCPSSISRRGFSFETGFSSSQIIGSGWDEEDMTAIHLLDFLYLTPISTGFLDVHERRIVWGLIPVPTGRADLEFRRIGILHCGRESALKILQREFEEFRKLSRNSGSTRFGLQGDGKFIFPMV